jgi:hypothetical protein
VVNGQVQAAGGPTGSPVGPEPTLVVPDLDHETRHDLSSTGPDAGQVVDSALVDLVTGGDRSRGEGADGSSGVPGLPGAGEVKDATELERIPPGRIDPTGVARPVELPPRVRSVECGLIRVDTISEALLEELPAAAVGSPGRLAVPADPIVRLETPQEPGKGLARLAATLIVAFSWDHRARFRGVTSRQARRPRCRKDAE